MKDLYQKFTPELARLIEGNSRIAVAVSGGSDSMALVLLLAEYVANNDTQLIAITVDHGLRAESRKEAKLVQSWLATHGVKHHILSWNGQKKTSNIQAEARKARYKLIADFCRAKKIHLLAVAHTSDDIAETVLMRLMRGSGIDGLTGIAESKEIFGINIVRPLLNFTRQDLQMYLRDKQQEWVNDPSNLNNKFKRIEVRNFIKTSNNPELLVKRLNTTANHMERAKDYIEERMRERLSGVFSFHELGYYTIDIDRFKLLHTEEQLRSLASALQHIGGQEYRPRFENLCRLNNKILNDSKFNGCTLWGCEISKGKKVTTAKLLYIYREPAKAERSVYIKNNSKTTWDNRFICDVGNINDVNLEISCLGNVGYKYINNANSRNSSLNNNNNSWKTIPKKILYTIPALKALEKVLAVPHIGYYDGEMYREVFNSNAKEPSVLFK